MSNGIELNFDNIYKNYGRHPALKGFSYVLREPWQCLGVLGRNGAGKSTLLRILVGLMPPSEGKVVISMEGFSANHLGPREAVFVDEEKAVIPALTGQQYLDFYQALNTNIGVETDIKLREHLVELFELSDQLEKRFEEMSKGTKRKTELTAAMSTRVPIVVADEIAEGMDIPSMQALQQTMFDKNLKRRYIVSSHDMSFISHVCDVIVVIDRGICVDNFCPPRLGEDISERVLAAFGEKTLGAQ